MKFFDRIYENDFDKKDLRIGRYFLIITGMIMLLAVYTLAFVDVVARVEVKGSVVPYKYREIYSFVGGRLKSVHKNDGDTVHADELILEIDNEDVVKEYFTAQNSLFIKQKENAQLIPEVNCSRLEKQIAVNSLQLAQAQFDFAAENYGALKVHIPSDVAPGAQLVLAIDPHAVGKSIAKNDKLFVINESVSEWKILSHLSDNDIHYVDSDSVAQIKTPMLRGNQRNEFNGKVTKIYLYKTSDGYPIEIKADTDVRPPLFSTTTVKIIGKKQKVYEYILYELLR